MIHHKVQTLTESISPAGATVSQVGRLAGMNNQGDILVEFDGQGPIAARLVAGFDRKELGKVENKGQEALLLFEQGDPQRPIIIALMENLIESLISFGNSEEMTERPEAALVDGKRVIIEAENEVILRCGKGSIQIRKDGRIIIKGTDVLSRSSGRQRVRGASVSIN